MPRPRSIAALDAYILAGKTFGETFAPNVSGAQERGGCQQGPNRRVEKAQAYQDALQALDRLEKRVYYLQQARQIGIQQLPQIRIVQSGDETLIENLQATSELHISGVEAEDDPASRPHPPEEGSRSAEDGDRRHQHHDRAGLPMMKDQAIAIEQAQRGIIDIETLEQANRDLIDTIQGVVKVQEEGRGKRAAGGTPDGAHDGRVEESPVGGQGLNRPVSHVAAAAVLFGLAFALAGAGGKAGPSFDIVSDRKISRLNRWCRSSRRAGGTPPAR